MTRRPRRNLSKEFVEKNQGKHFCHCGCGKPINITVWHWWKNKGKIPKYLPNHNPNSRKNFLENNPNKGRKYTKAERKRLGDYRRGVKFTPEQRKKRSEIMKKADLSGLKNVDTSKRRKCKWENCSNMVYGVRDYCVSHWLMSDEGKAENRARAELYHIFKIGPAQLKKGILEAYTKIKLAEIQLRG